MLPYTLRLVFEHPLQQHGASLSTPSSREPPKIEHNFLTTISSSQTPQIHSAVIGVAPKFEVKGLYLVMHPPLA